MLQCGSFNGIRGRHSRKQNNDTENIYSYHHATSTSARKDRRRTIDRGLARPSITTRGCATQRITRILPQRTITPRYTTGVQSIWFQSESEHPDFGVPLADMLVENGVEGFMVAPEERVFQEFGLDLDEIQFSILVSVQLVSIDPPTNPCPQWPGYGHTSWIASITINFREGGGHWCGPITRRLLATAVAQHFQAFMTVSLPRQGISFRFLTLLCLESLVLALPPPRSQLEDYERPREWHQVRGPPLDAAVQLQG